MALSELHKLPPGAILVGLFVAWLVYLAALAIYRLYLHPLAKFPGSRLTALTKWYEFYYEVILRGQFSFKVEEMHKKYGPIVRITPYELHVNTSEFWETLYVKYPKSFKYDWMNGRFGNESSMFTTCDPVLHRIRRAPLNPMFSRRAVGQCESIVQERINFLNKRLQEFLKHDQVVPVQRVWSAFAGDVIMEYSFGFHDDQLGSEDFEKTLHDAFLSASKFGNIALQFPTLVAWMQSLPDSWMKAMNPQLAGFITLQQDLRSTISRIIKEQKQPEKQPPNPTIFHEILASDCPAPEKASRRLADEAQTIIGAGLSTTAWALTTAVYYILAEKNILAKLRTELFDAIPDLSKPDAFLLQNLETLPYLRGCVREGVRLSNTIGNRIPRIMPFALDFQGWVIPPGTPVSMSIRDVHFDPAIYPKPNDFVPERWMGNPKAPDGESLEHYWVAFGKGPRMCLGINLAYMELFVGLATFFRRFRSELYETDFTDVEMKHDFLLPSPKLDSKGVRVKITGLEK